jgi:hypothetical protein
MVCDFYGRYNGRRCEFHGLPCVIPALFVLTNEETVLFEYYLAGYGRGVSAARSGISGCFIFRVPHREKAVRGQTDAMAILILAATSSHNLRDFILVRNLHF